MPVSHPRPPSSSRPPLPVPRSKHLRPPSRPAPSGCCAPTTRCAASCRAPTASYVQSPERNPFPRNRFLEEFPADQTPQTLLNAAEHRIRTVMARIHFKQSVALPPEVLDQRLRARLVLLQALPHHFLPVIIANDERHPIQIT